MYLVKTPQIIKKLFPQYVWDIAHTPQSVYLTFDDGPHPEITAEVLRILDTYQAKSTFFCVGKNAEQYPEIMKRIREQGHTTGNHTYSHSNAWQVGRETFLSDVKRCEQVFSSAVFRPPYGKITPYLSQKIAQKIIMWDVLSGDFDPLLPKEKCLNNVLNHVSGGSVIVFHDSEKAYERMIYALPRVLDWLHEKGLVCEAIKKGTLSV